MRSWNGRESGILRAWTNSVVPVQEVLTTLEGELFGAFGAGPGEGFAFFELEGFNHVSGNGDRETSTASLDVPCFEDSLSEGFLVLSIL